jgi:Tol biopolymer transport system component
VAYTNGGLWVATLLNVHTRIYSGSAGEPAWSPDGSKIAFNNGIGSILTIKPNGSGLRTAVARTSTMIFYNPYWSASGSHLVFTGQDASGSAPNMDVFRATATGGSRTNLTNTPAPFKEYLSNFAGGGWR